MLITTPDMNPVMLSTSRLPRVAKAYNQKLRTVRLETLPHPSLGADISTFLDVELPCKSEFIPIAIDGKNLRDPAFGDSSLPSTRDSERFIEPPVVLENLAFSQSVIMDDDISDRPPCRSNSNRRVRLSEIEDLTESHIILSSIPSIGYWERGACLGEGSQGNVYKATSITNQFEFAVKCLREDDVGNLDNMSIDSRTEIENMSSVNHPAIIQCYGAEIIGGHLCIFMEFCVHGSLSKFIESSGRLKEDAAKSISKQLLEAVNYLHTRKRRPLMHRDIKASNILISHFDTFGIPVIKLCDFGSSTRRLKEDGELKRGLRQLSPTSVEVVPDHSSIGSTDSLQMKELLSSTIKGTCNWIAPEVLKGQAYSAGCDIWSVGCTVIEMLTGRLPWKIFDNPLAGMFNIATSTETPMSTIDPLILGQMSDDCKDFLLKSVERDPHLRWTARRLLKHVWLRVPLETIPATPVGYSSDSFPGLYERAII